MAFLFPLLYTPEAQLAKLIIIHNQTRPNAAPKASRGTTKVGRVRGCSVTGKAIARRWRTIR